MENIKEYILYICSFLLLGCYVFASDKARSDDNFISIQQTGNDFELWIEQIGYDHTVMADVTGEGNLIMVSQHESGHTTMMDIIGDTNSVFVMQEYGGSHLVDLNINNEDNDVSVLQRNMGSHTASISLDGTYGTTLQLDQDSVFNQSYSLTQNCLNPSGCSISVLQQ